MFWSALKHVLFDWTYYRAPSWLRGTALDWRQCGRWLLVCRLWIHTGPLIQQTQTTGWRQTAPGQGCWYFLSLCCCFSQSIFRKRFPNHISFVLFVDVLPFGHILLKILIIQVWSRQLRRNIIMWQINGASVSFSLCTWHCSTVFNGLFCWYLKILLTVRFYNRPLKWNTEVLGQKI